MDKATYYIDELYKLAKHIPNFDPIVDIGEFDFYKKKFVLNVWELKNSNDDFFTRDQQDIILSMRLIFSKWQKNINLKQKNKIQELYDRKKQNYKELLLKKGFTEKEIESWLTTK
ncbi:hypothetical protein IGK74_002329 [Enterococcus sp. AZ150]|uniref:hypothetical protein n=1 Tax=Enterococcus sp. AZ150 TaxID=2774866 RepID=UPI003F21FDAC